MIYIYEFSDVIVNAGMVPAEICRGKGRHISMHYMALADRMYTLVGTRAKMLKNRNGKLNDFDLSGEDAVALVLKAVVL